MDISARTRLLIGGENAEKLKNASVAVFGVGGVGGFVVEAIARSGVGHITVFDNDTVAESNINRQIIATVPTLGKDKTQLIRERVLAINPQAVVDCNNVFYLPENADLYPFDGYDYVIDAVDTVAAKIEIIRRAKAAHVPVISCMGTGGKTDITALKVADIKDTKQCPLARVMRRELAARNISGVKVVYSEEPAVRIDGVEHPEKRQSGRPVPASMIFVPAAAGLMLAREVVFDLIKQKTF